MATMAQTRKRQTTAKDKLRRQAKDSLAALFAQRDAAVRRGEFELLGRICLLRTERGDVDFGQDRGPFIARLQNGELAMMSEWRQFPAVVSATSELCDDCRAKCLGCNGAGERLCMGIKCGGEGRMILGHEPCPAIGCVRLTGQANPGCEQCQGVGQIVSQSAECLACKGSGKQQCPACQGSGQMATGRRYPENHVGASRDSDAPACESCRGSGRKLVREPQPWEAFVAGELEGFAVLGPIFELVWKADVCRDAGQAMELVSILPDEDGNLGALLVREPAKSGQPWYWLGGKLGPIGRL